MIKLLQAADVAVAATEAGKMSLGSCLTTEVG